MIRKGSRVTGKLELNSKGFGFVCLEKQTDIFIHFDNLANAMDGDVVEAQILKTGAKPSGKITKIVERSGKDILGVFRKDKRGGKVYPEDERLPSSLVIPSEEIKKAKLSPSLKDEMVVVAQLVN